MKRDDLERLSKADLVDAYLVLQARFDRPIKTSQTSSKPPSTDQKAKREQSKPGGAKLGHKGHYRQLTKNPDRIIQHHPKQCSGCGSAFDRSSPEEILGEYDRIDLPPITPFVERHQRLSCTCRCCGLVTKAAVPDAACGSPFGPGIVSLVVYLKHYQLASYQRLQSLLADVTGLKLSQGTIMNMLARAKKSFCPEHDVIIARLRQAEAVASDETGMRIEGINAQQWVFRSKEAVVHTSVFSRAAQVAKEMMGDHKPEFWISDRYSAQQKHGVKHQTCLAHLARDIARVQQVGDAAIGFALKRWIKDVFALSKTLMTDTKETIERKCRDLEERIDSILNETTSCDVTGAVLRKFCNARDQLLIFVERPDIVSITNNDCEQALRMSVITRKVTNGFRAMWAAQADSTIRTVVDTHRLSGATPYQTIHRILAA